jgi:glycogen phosphorylase
LSAEYLPGPHLANNLLNLGITKQTREALAALGYDLDDILAQEGEPGLGNGGARTACVVLHGFSRIR